jgi:hypothetical protein
MELKDEVWTSPTCPTYEGRLTKMPERMIVFGPRATELELELELELEVELVWLAVAAGGDASVLMSSNARRKRGVLFVD